MKIFLVTSFSSRILPDGRVEPGYRKQIEGVIDHLESVGHEVFCGMRQDGWRLQADDPAAAFIYDVTSIEQADLLVVLMSNKPVSAGIEFELGYAFALHRQIIILTQADDRPVPYINIGLIEQPNVHALTYRTLMEIPELLAEVLGKNR